MLIQTLQPLGHNQYLIGKLLAPFNLTTFDISVDDSNATRKVSMYTNQGRDWQECPNRNWAAEFGYGGGRTSIGATRDILSKMALSFKSDDEEEEKNDKNTR